MGWLIGRRHNAAFIASLPRFTSVKYLTVCFPGDFEQNREILPLWRNLTLTGWIWRSAFGPYHPFKAHLAAKHSFLEGIKERNRDLPGMLSQIAEIEERSLVPHLLYLSDQTSIYPTELFEVLRKNLPDLLPPWSLPECPWAEKFKEYGEKRKEILSEKRALEQELAALQRQVDDLNL